MQYAYAFDEFRNLLSRFVSPFSEKDPVVRYARSLVAALAYHHVPKFEIDERKRAQLIPCDEFRNIVASGNTTDVVTYLQEADFGTAFTIVDRSIVGVGITQNGILFIGLRGTVFLFEDWLKVNLKTPLVEIGGINFISPYVRGYEFGRAHKGFTEEAVRISIRIREAIREKGIKNIQRVILTGHSLGGAVAALSEKLIQSEIASTFIFGSPRYCDVSAYYSLLVDPPIQIQRPGDMVPFIPPRRLGYADHPRQFGTNGEPLYERARDYLLPPLAWASFLARRCRPHKMELYRHELGQMAGADAAEKPLAPYEKLTHTHMAGVS